MVVRAADVQFIFNAQHNCLALQCGIQSTATYEQQERITTSCPQNSIKHQPILHFIINMHSLHNPHLIRQVLPQELVEPLPYQSHRWRMHDASAAILRITGPKKRADALEKAKKTRQANADRLLAGKDIRSEADNELPSDIESDPADSEGDGES
ncbi:hypothetical protein V5O48_015268 [Marasmius crinis-equi]|uniref:Uncharacterized protein n=1 Tax=Marasmius crinis-equi TaxID=585013 RepID=A0ABR3EUZ6_9AGAR